MTCTGSCQDRFDPVFNKGQDVELASVIDATPQINSCMKTTNKNTHICFLIH